MTLFARFRAYMRGRPTAFDMASAIALAIVLGVAGSALLLHWLTNVLTT